MIKVYELIEQQILTFDWFTYFAAVTIQPRREIFEIFQKYFTKYFMKYFTPKSFMKFYITS